MTAVRVVGAGLSGLAAAWTLVDAGCRVDVVDAASSPGGLIRTTRTPHGLVEQAANAFVWNDNTARWFAGLGIPPSFARPAARRRYIFARGRPRRWPLTMGASIELGARLLNAAVRRQLAPRDAESVAAFSDRIAGRQATRTMIGPAIGGVYGAAPDRLLARAVFGGRRAGRRVMAAPPGGMGEFVERLHDRLRDRGVVFAFGQRLDALDPSVPTIVCTNVGDAARLLGDHAPALARALLTASMTSLLTATAFFEHRIGDLDGFGVLFPRDSGILALGALFNTSIFEGRGSMRSETWIYSSDDGSGLPSDAAVVRRLGDDRHGLTGRSDTPIAVTATRQAPALPLYNEAIPSIQSRLADLPPWLGLAGNYLGQIGVSALLVQAEAAARTLARRQA
jgi:oxygen-dependent protoporphyrinogen oxidase